MLSLVFHTKFPTICLIYAFFPHEISQCMFNILSFIVFYTKFNSICFIIMLSFSILHLSIVQNDVRGSKYIIEVMSGKTSALDVVNKLQQVCEHNVV